MENYSFNLYWIQCSGNSKVIGQFCFSATFLSAVGDRLIVLFSPKVG